MKPMFCPKCGAIDQRPESYCTRCGQWLPDMDSRHRRRFLRNLTPNQRVQKMRILEICSAAFSIMAAMIIIFSTPGDTGTLKLAVICCLMVAAYQVINFYLGYKLHNRTERGRTDDTRAVAGDAQATAPQLNAADTNLLIRGRASAIENTTELLDPLPRKAQPDR